MFFTTGTNVCWIQIHICWAGTKNQNWFILMIFRKSEKFTIFSWVDVQYDSQMKNRIKFSIRFLVYRTVPVARPSRKSMTIIHFQSDNTSSEGNGHQSFQCSFEKSKCDEIFSGCGLQVFWRFLSPIVSTVKKSW